MILLTIIVCLASGAGCQERQDFALFSMPMACAVAGQQVAAEWLKAHPSFVLRQVRCEPEDRKQLRT